MTIRQSPHLSMEGAHSPGRPTAVLGPDEAGTDVVEAVDKDPRSELERDLNRDLGIILKDIVP